MLKILVNLLNIVWYKTTVLMNPCLEQIFQNLKSSEIRNTSGPKQVRNIQCVTE
jgi:hypothetical protein